MSQLGLGLNLSKTKGGVVPFNPLSLDPYLLFDAQSSMIGTLENPTLDLDPSKPDTLNVITATRSGVATYTDADGLIQSADPDTVRVDYVDGVPMILVEPSATNSIEHSEDFSHSSYYSNPSSTAVGGDAPMSGKTGTICTFNSSSSSESLIYLDSTSFSSGDVVCQSIYVKKGTASEVNFWYHTGNSARYTFNFDNQTLTQGYSPQHIDSGFEDVGNGWFRIYFSITLANGAWPKIFVPSTETFPATVELFGFQLEAGSVPTSYIPTSGSTVTRAADDLVISGSDFSDFYNQSEGTVYAEAITQEPDLSYILSLSDGTNDNRSLLYYNNESLIQTYSSSGAVVQATHSFAVTAGTLSRGAFSLAANNYLSSVNGSSQSDNSFTMPAVDRLNIGASGSSNKQLNGHIKRLIYWPYHSDSL